ncbi:MAG: cysteine hydrolase family protein [Vicinamibacterales bacterium]
MFEIDPARALVLCMDFQNDIVTRFVPVSPEVLERAGQVLNAARAANIPVVHVVVQFRPGHPEVADRGPFQVVRRMNGLVEGTEGAAIHPAVAPRDGEIIVTKRRVSAFAGSDLDCILRASGRTHLILLGVATSGVVLSTVRAAGDLDYDMNVVGDCCADADEEIHTCLVEKVFARMAPSVTASDVIAAVGRPA